MRSNIRWRQRWIRLRHWEYWPFHIVNFPVYFYWAWLALKARSWFFFNTANPLIRNGGFLMESKKEIYNLIPKGLYPATVLARSGTSLHQLRAMMDSAGLTFPIVAKPDIGMRGLAVAVVSNESELAAYVADSKVDFLLQELVEFRNEAGIFLCRLPNEKAGRITGIVGKEFLCVVGDGHSTIAQLLLKNSRAVLQWQALAEEYGEGLNRLLAKGETLTLVPFGNHSRGAKFVDWSHRIDDELTATFNRICGSIPQFYYGRMDVRFRSWEELKRGEHFSIIELNGAGSEPTHIYDPKHSIFFAWQEIIRHLNMLYTISKQAKAVHGLRYMATAEGLAVLKANSRHVALLKKQGTNATRNSQSYGITHGRLRNSAPAGLNTTNEAL